MWYKSDDPLIEIGLTKALNKSLFLKIQKTGHYIVSCNTRLDPQVVHAK